MHSHTHSYKASLWMALCAYLTAASWQRSSELIGPKGDSDDIWKIATHARRHLASETVGHCAEDLKVAE
jgi:hypothetical protein